jgi:DNA-binding CsgD family transcriptional regulator
LTVALADREGDILRGLRSGESYQDIARTLYVTENTVKTHLASLYRKLRADRRHQPCDAPATSVCSELPPRLGGEQTF